jgi:predicted nucleic acid-binding protein
VSVHFDSSVLVAALVDSDPHHEPCLNLLRKGGASVFVHALAETFNTMTGGKLVSRILPSIVSEVLAVSVLPRVQPVTLSAAETIAAMKETEERGVRGGAIYDYLHLVAARKARARQLYTLDFDNFRSFHRTGDPAIVHP